MARTSMTLDIHRYEMKWTYAERQVRNSDLSQLNKDLIISFRDTCLVRNVCGRVRLLRVLGCLRLYARLFNKDFDQATRQDVEQLVSRLVTAQPPYSPETLGTYKSILKSFMTWVVQPDQFPTKTPPPIVSWITCHVRTRDKKRLERKDLLTPEDIDYVNAHGTGTPENDKMEWFGISAVFGERALSLPVSSNKSMIGHTLTAAGAIEAIFSIKTIEDGILPPTINYRHPDPAIDLDVVPNVARNAQVNRILSNSFGFGGQNACLVIAGEPA